LFPVLRVDQVGEAAVYEEVPGLGPPGEDLPHPGLGAELQVSGWARGRSLRLLRRLFRDVPCRSRSRIVVARFTARSITATTDSHEKSRKPANGISG